MSFSGTPLGSGKRLDHASFMLGAKPPSRETRGEENNPSTGDRPPSPRRRAAPLSNSITHSYAYGAASTSKHSPVKPSSSSSHRAPSPARSTASTHKSSNRDDDPLALTTQSQPVPHAHEPGSIRYQRLKQRNQALGPGIITTPPRPNGASLRDTSVIVATAFHQAAAANSMPSTTSLRPKPSSRGSATSESQNRYLAPPGSRRPVPPRQLSPAAANGEDGDEVEETDEHGRPVNRRGKSPLQALVSAARAASPAAMIMLRAFSPPTSNDGQQFQSMFMPDSANGTAAEISNTFDDEDQESYDYEAEDQMVADMARSNGSSQSARQPPRKKKPVPFEQKAYKPGPDESSDEDDDGGPDRRSRKRLSGRATLDGSLPSIGKDKKKKKTKRKSGAAKGQQQDEEASPVVAPSSSLPRDEEALPENADTSMEVPATDADTTLDDFGAGDADDTFDLSEAQVDAEVIEIRSDDENDTFLDEAPVTRSGGRIGAALGRVVNFVAAGFGYVLRICFALGFIASRVVVSIFEAVFIRPLGWAQHTVGGLAQEGRILTIGRWVAAVVAISVGYRFLAQSSSSSDVESQSWIGRWKSPQYEAPGIPPETLQELIDRLTRIERSHNKLSHDRSEDLRLATAMDKRMAHLDHAVDTVARRVDGAEESYRSLYQQKSSELQMELEAVRSTVSTLADRVDDAQPQAGAEIRLQLAQLAERLGGIEGLAKEALESSKHAIKAPSGSGWWSQSTTDGKPIIIRSNDGKDITALLGSLVDTAVSRHHKDDIAKRDFALYSGGGRIAPSMTTPSFRIRPNGWVRYLVGSITGSDFASGRPPVVALNPDNNVGNCWPFAGSSGQLAVVLSRQVQITEVTVDHTPRELAMDLQAAPREIKVWGLVEGQDNLEKLASYYSQAGDQERETYQPLDHLSKSGAVAHVLLSSFTYDIAAPSHIQSFPVDEAVRNLGLEIGVVVFQFLSNWGNPDYTCVYRVRVHGTDPRQSLPLMDTTPSP